MMSILLALACTPEVKDTATPVNLAPQIDWVAPTERLVEGQDVQISLSIVDEDGIQEAMVYHRAIGSSYWEQIPLENTEGDTWAAIIPSIALPGVEFYFKAEDQGSPIATALYPTNGPSEPLSLSAYPESRPLPFNESFELSDGQITTGH